jgi:hypothetical protein
MSDPVSMQRALLQATGFSAEEILAAASPGPPGLAGQFRRALERYRSLSGSRSAAVATERDRLDSWLRTLLAEGGLLPFGGHLLHVLSAALRAAAVFGARKTRSDDWLRARIDLAAAADRCFWNLRKTPIPFDAVEIGEDLQRLGRIALARLEMDREARGLGRFDVEGRAAAAANRILDLLVSREAKRDVFERARRLLDPSHFPPRQRLACARGLLGLAGQAGSLRVVRRCEQALRQIGDVVSSEAESANGA